MSTQILRCILKQNSVGQLFGKGYGLQLSQVRSLGRRPHTDVGDTGEERRKVIPKLVYLHNPWQYILAKANFFKLWLFWDREFIEKEFIRGSKQAAIFITNIIRSQNVNRIIEFTTPLGFQQIRRDMQLSENDTRLGLVNFDPEHIRRAIPMKVATRTKSGRRYCFVDMLFVGLRNAKDFKTAEEVVECKRILDKLDADTRTPAAVSSVPHRIIFAEIFIRFRRNYTQYDNSIQILPEIKEQREATKGHWSICFYKILSFDILNYDP